MADAAPGGRKDVMKALRISRQRLSSAANGGPRLRAERLVHLGILTGVDITDALRAGGQTHLAELLKQAFPTPFADASPLQRRLLRACDELPARMQQAIVHLVTELAKECAECRRGL